MFEIIVVGSVGLTLLAIAALEIVDSLVDGRRLASVPPPVAPTPRPVVAAPVAQPVIMALPKAA